MTRSEEQRLAPSSVVAMGGVSAFGVGEESWRAGELGAPARVAWRVDPALRDSGLHRPFAARAAAPTTAAAAPTAVAVAPTARAAAPTAGAVAPAALASSELRAVAERATYFAPACDVLSAYGLAGVRRRTLILAACAASTIAMGVGMRWLDRGACDLVLAGGFDGISVFVAAGFEALRATTASAPRPFRKGRDGMCLGEGAGLVAMVRRGEERGARPRFFVCGFGASTDAVHITAPDATGGGLSRAALAAVADAGEGPIDLVSAHATATPYNDAMEARAIRAATARAEPALPIVHPFKAQIGHTLGAAGVLETLAAADAIVRGVAPAAAGEGELDPEAAVQLLASSEARSMGRALKLSAAFGGANASLVVSSRGEDRPARARSPVFVTAGARVVDHDLAALSEATGVARDRLARLDGLCRLGLSAVAALAAKVGRERLRGAGIVAGHALATLDTNDAFDARKRSRGPTGVEPRAFPATSPNAVAGECAIVYKLTGPSFATGAGLDGATEALTCAAELLSAGDASAMIVLAADDAGPASRDLLAAIGSTRPFARGAGALLLTTFEGGPPVDLDALPDHDRAPIGHLALLPLLASIS
ncbi:MAG: beta-ketoacyl synthase N-terminal-like domain-containing protein [Polyangiaceae bacterium]